MFELIGYSEYSEDKKFAQLRCECNRTSTIFVPFSDLKSHLPQYCILKDGVELVCPYCGRKQTEKHIPLEPQIIREEYLPSSKSNLPYWMTRDVTTEELLRAIVYD